ncbi:hypothetical protein L2E82_50058 [Cichorium intybus]|nr:hypothetical protein L2E82_50058 [Cichorium intybus]
MKKTSFSKFTNVESDPIILDFDSDYSTPSLASPFHQNPKKTDPKGDRNILALTKGLRFDGVDVERGRPSICCWNASTMRLREELEMA